MGRALFSEKYNQVLVRSEPDSSPLCPEKWSRWNYFDPDSDEFFQDAEREVFTDTEEYRRELEEEQRHFVDLDNPDGLDSSASSESSEPSEHGSVDVVPSNIQYTMINENDYFTERRRRIVVTGFLGSGAWNVTQSHHPQSGVDTRIQYETIPTTEHARYRHATPTRARAASLSSSHLQSSPLRNSIHPISQYISARIPIQQPIVATATVPVMPLPEPSTPHQGTPLDRGVDSVSSFPTRYLPISPFPPSLSPHILSRNRRPLVAVPSSPLSPQSAMGMHNSDARVSRVNVIPPPLVHVQNTAV